MGKTIRRVLTSGLALGAAMAGAVQAADGPGAAVFESFTYRGADPAHAGLTPGDDTYLNPILQGFYPDPSITRAGDDYYLVTSTFSYFPGIPVFHSRDLVNWTQIGNAIDRPDQLDFGRLGLSRGVFAPTIEHRDGVFYIFNTCVDCGDNFVITARDPAGPWSDPVWLPDLAGGIDPGVFFDDDGSAWVVNNGPPEGPPRYEGHRAVWIQRFDPQTLTTFGPRKVLVDGGVDPSTNPIWIEGPHIIRRGDWYYLICAEGGTAEGHSQVVLRSRSPDGPYEAWSGNPILTQRDLPRDRPYPITSAGHADLVQLPDGSWWATFLAVRPYGDDMYNTGRETFLLPVDWSGEWPVILENGRVIPYALPRPGLPGQPDAAPPTAGAFEVIDTFDGPTLPPYWMMMRNPRETWFDLSRHPGALTLTPRADGLGDNANPSFLGRRQQHQYATAETELRAVPAGEGELAGLAVLQSDEYWYSLAAVRRGGEPRIELRRRRGPGVDAAGEVIAAAPLGGEGPVRFRISARAGAYDFAWARAEGGWQTLLERADGEMLSTRVAGGFVGAVFGPFAQSAP
ncbi:MAG TPA: glycoside hydrolase family 43 protein [Brevundimonas sp.]|jgi:alpha-N-arabinofuranosidase|uniref:glycoside hydrolase family 43 protein n=1 Tax=Brevundimonas sp. TaxID=1871086 RepID=UPI002E159036|nr:glycoside hydrolase family 43 protein [Brevundimonas sp.]